MVLKRVFSRPYGITLNNGSMDHLQQYLPMYIGSQVFSLVILLLAWKRPVWTRYIFAALFVAAGAFNWYTAMTTPEVYLMYADLTIPLYHDFITGWFKDHITLLVPAIATGQVLIGAGLLAGGRWFDAACLGIVIFLLAIAPLGVGSAFPFSVTVSIAAYFVYRNRRRQNNKMAR